ncbi:hypothetical protein Pmani_014919 [Petrolisthes manimaculis]|uniref:Pyrroline-5-carboxylate reductase n=1 Tax=Petrolisthes manimaculis TaxID=1843537 RepID=A0AAE1PTA7_9EUCA|nr:hypothetical protein Pmani_014919 [Petrolisthes manimaculis]
MTPKPPSKPIKSEIGVVEEAEEDGVEECRELEVLEATVEEEVSESAGPEVKIVKKSRWEQSRRSRKFCGKWLNIPEIREWVHPIPTDPTYVWCKMCKSKIRAHLNDLKTHKSTKKHKRNMATYEPELPPAETMDCGNGIFVSFSTPKIRQGEMEDPESGVLGGPNLSSMSTLGGKEVVNPASLGFIGSGNMAQALLGAFIKKGLVDPPHVTASAPSVRNLTKLCALGVCTTHDNNMVVMKSDVVFLCVKPHLLNNVIASLDPLPPDHNPLFVSIVTGHDIDSLEEMLSTLVERPRVIRTMPNTPAMIGQGCCLYTLGTHATPSDGSVMHSMLSSVGVCAEIPEQQMDAACGLAGSGPAYIYAAIEAMADGGVKMGLPRHLAQSLAAQMVKGSASMVLESGKHPGQLKDEVCSPSGTTISAMHVLEKAGFRNALISAVEASALRSKELGGNK